MEGREEIFQKIHQTGEVRGGNSHLNPASSLLLFVETH